MIGAILSAIPAIIGMFNSSSANDDYQGKLSAIMDKQRLSSSALQAKSLLAENASRGLPGYETAKEDIYSQMPMSLNAAKDWLTSGGVVDFLAKAGASTSQQLRNLNAANDQARQNNMLTYANYLGSTMAGEENRLAGTMAQLGLMGANADVYAAAAQNNLLTGLIDNLGQGTTTDLSSLIALLSKNKQITPQAISYQYDEPGNLEKKLKPYE